MRTTTDDDPAARLRRALLVGTLAGIVGITGIVALADGGLSPDAATAGQDQAPRAERVRTRTS